MGNITASGGHGERVVVRPNVMRLSCDCHVTAYHPGV